MLCIHQIKLMFQKRKEKREKDKKLLYAVRSKERI